MVDFTTIPSDIKAPGVYAEVNTRRVDPSLNYRVLLIGHMLTGGTAEASTPTVVGDDPVGQFGNGSMLCEMAYYAKHMDPGYRIYALPIAEPTTSAVAATCTVTVAATTLTEARKLDVYLGARGVDRLSIQCYSGDTEDEIAARLVEAINAGYKNGSRTVKWAVSAAVGGVGSENIVTLTARHKGAPGNSLRFAAWVHAGDDKLARDILTVSGFSGGAGTVDMAAALALLGDAPYDTIVSPYADSDAIADIDLFLADREGYDKQLYGHAILAKYDTYANLITAGSAFNSRYVTLVGLKQPLDPVWRLVAEIGGMVGNHFDGSTRKLGMKKMRLQGASYAESDGFTFAERDQLLRNGISTLTVEPNRRLYIDRLITTYQTDLDGNLDEVWMDLATRYRMIIALRSITAMLSGRYSRRAYDRDGHTTRRDMAADIVNRYRELAQIGLLTHEDSIRSRVKIAEAGIDRLNVFLPLYVQSDLHVVAINATVGVA